MKARFLLIAFLFGLPTRFSCQAQSQQDATFAAIQTDTIKKYEIPIKYLRGHLYLPTIINDSVKGNFIFDTGADGLYIDNFFLSQKKLPATPSHSVYLGGIGEGGQKVKQVRGPYTFRIGLFTLKWNEAVTIFLKTLVGRYADGLVGFDFIKNSALYIDYIREIIQFIPPGVSFPQGFEKIPLTFNFKSKRFFITAEYTVQGHKIKGPFMLDLGAGNSVLTNQCARQNKLAKKLPFKIKCYTTHGGTGGKSSSYSSRADTFQLGNFKIIAPLLSYSCDKKGILSKMPYIGLLGNDIWEQFDIILDLPNSALYLRPNKNYNRKQEISTVGVDYVDRTDICDGWIIRALCKKFPAEKAGLKIGDIILDINGIKVKEIPCEEQKLFWKNLDIPYLLTVQRDNQIHSIKIEPVKFSE